MSDEVHSALAPGVVVVLPVGRPDTDGFFFLDRNLDWDIVTLLLVLLGAMLLGHILAVGHGVVVATLVGNLGTLLFCGVVAALLGHLLTGLAVVVGWLADLLVVSSADLLLLIMALIPVVGGALLLLLVHALLLVRGLAMLFLLVVTMLFVDGLTLVIILGLANLSQGPFFCASSLSNNMLR